MLIFVVKQRVTLIQSNSHKIAAQLENHFDFTRFSRSDTADDDSGIGNVRNVSFFHSVEAANNSEFHRVKQRMRAKRHNDEERRRNRRMKLKVRGMEIDFICLLLSRLIRLAGKLSRMRQHSGKMMMMMDGRWMGGRTEGVELAWKNIRISQRIFISLVCFVTCSLIKVVDSA